MDVTVYGPLRSATEQKTVSVAFGGGTVREALAAFVEAYPRAERQLYRDDGSLEPSVRITVSGEPADPDDECPEDATVSIHPAMQGG